MIGGNTTATDAAYLSEYFQTAGLKTSVACVPCTISGGMKNNFVVSRQKSTWFSLVESFHSSVFFLPTTSLLLMPVL